eukprot:c26061_g1_i1 orf=380-2200(-)
MIGQSESATMNNQVFVFGSFTEDEANFFQSVDCPKPQNHLTKHHIKENGFHPLQASHNGTNEVKGCKDDEFSVGLGIEKLVVQPSGSSQKTQGIASTAEGNGLSIYEEFICRNNYCEKTGTQVDFVKQTMNIVHDIGLDSKVKLWAGVPLDNNTKGITTGNRDTHISDSSAACASAWSESDRKRMNFGGQGGDLEASSTFSCESITGTSKESHLLIPLTGKAWLKSLLEAESTRGRLQPRGLINTGNLCFLNATLQALLSCSPFVHLLRMLQSQSIPEIGFPTLRACIDFSKHFEELVIPEKTCHKAGLDDGRIIDSIEVGRPFSPTMFDTVVKSFSPDQPVTGAGRTRQEDAQEFLSFTMDCMHEELLRLEGRGRDFARGDRVNTVTSSDEDDWETVGPKNRTAVIRTYNFMRSALSDIFGGQLCSVVRTKGNKASATVQPFLLLHLDILPDAVHSIENALRFFAARESLEGYKAANSKAAVVGASKSVKIQSLPKVLILHLMRFSYGVGGSSKLHKPIHFSFELTLARDLLSASTNVAFEGRRYELVATVTHHGRDPSCGHYTADSKQADGRWLHFDDAAVSVVGLNRVLHDQAYILFYKQMAL